MVSSLVTSFGVVSTAWDLPDTMSPAWQRSTVLDPFLGRDSLAIWNGDGAFYGILSKYR